MPPTPAPSQSSPYHRLPGVPSTRSSLTSATTTSSQLRGSVLPFPSIHNVLRGRSQTVTAQEQGKDICSSIPGGSI